MNFDEFKAKYLGKAVDYDHTAGVQCVDLFDQYLKDCFGITGVWCKGAKDFYEKFSSYPSLKAAFDLIPNTPDLVVCKGDVVIWGGGSWGHVGIGTGEGNKTWFVTIEENTLGKHEPTQEVRHYFNNKTGVDGCYPVLGVLRPKIAAKSIISEVKGMSKKGIDISRHQGKPDFSKVKTAVDYVIIQAGYGRYSNQKDTEFERSYSECKKNKIPVGAYWYSYARTTAEAKQEAAVCIEVLKGKQFEYPIYYDLEENLGGMGKSLVSGIAEAFCTELEKAGYFVGIYMSRSPAQSYLTEAVAKRYTLWLAEYGSRLNYTGGVGMWQNSSTGKISGISGNVDTDICYEDFPTKIKAAGKNGYTAPKPAAKVLDSTGYKKGDKSEGVLAYKALLKIAAKLKICTAKVDDTDGFGGGTENATNALLKSWGYKENGIAGEKLVKMLTDKIIKKI